MLFKGIIWKLVDKKDSRELIYNIRMTVNNTVPKFKAAKRLDLNCSHYKK